MASIGPRFKNPLGEVEPPSASIAAAIAIIVSAAAAAATIAIGDGPARRRRRGRRALDHSLERVEPTVGRAPAVRPRKVVVEDRVRLAWRRARVEQRDHLAVAEDLCQPRAAAARAA